MERRAIARLWRIAVHGSTAAGWQSCDLRPWGLKSRLVTAGRVCPAVNWPVCSKMLMFSQHPRRAAAAVRMALLFGFAGIP